MSAKSINDITKDVRVAIDEIALNDAGFEIDQDNTEMNTIIASKIPDALRFVYSNADWSLLEPDTIINNTNTTLYSIEGKVGYCKFPEGFIRLVFAKFASWSRYLGQEDLILWNEPAYATLADQYATGTPARPKIAMAFDSSGAKRLELYGSGSTTDTFLVGCMTEPKESADHKYDIPDKVYRAVIYYIAGLTLTTYREAQPAQLMFTEANDLMGFSQQATQQVQQ